MDFAEKQLSKYGWVKGQGLGKEGKGKTEPIKVKLKRDCCGVGSEPGYDFTSQWWNKVFNSAAKNIQVKEENDGNVVVKSDADSASSLRKKHYDLHRNELSYGGFLDSTSLQCPPNKSGVVKVNKKKMVIESSAQKEDQEGVSDELGCVSDEVLFKACGGRTAHKGARHGLTLSGKLRRIQRQEASALSLKVPTKNITDTTTISTPCEGEGKRKRKKKRQDSKDEQLLGTRTKKQKK